MNILLIWIISIIIVLISAKLIQLQVPDYFISTVESTTWTPSDSMGAGKLIMILMLSAPLAAIIFLLLFLILSFGNLFKWLFSPKTSDDDEEVT